ncbi:glycosyltransferase [Carboxylicivirga linearis]|uniref:Glycosyltransferase n=1 Tax=Carboxylicivirga linearis TaxID=1628157 RepID=A0ABS5JVL6_9BACT|nr:glycosyltransferase [Carboxylicivirga linearis]MBS2098958.1 glycosyltransferase [Carboxylicivirga linearis]
MKIEFEIVFIGILGLSWAIQVFYYLWFMLKVSRLKPSATNHTTPNLSVIICAKNEAINLKKHLPIILNQDYPNFEVVVVNDASSDESDMILAELKKSHNNLYYTTIPENKQFYQGKKLALTLGVKAAKNEHLVFTDADCYPESDQWLKEISKAFDDSKEIVIGYGRFEKKKSLFNLFLRYETFFNTVQYMGFALRKKPFMAVGRNLAYRKSLFQKSNVFQQYLNIASGDDDLFIKECATPTNTTVITNLSSQTTSIPPVNFSEWLTRKARHLTTSKHYKFSIKWLLTLEPLSRQIFWTLGICSLFFHIFVPISLGLILSRIIVQYIVLAKAGKALSEKNLYIWSILFDVVIPFIIGSVWLQNMFSANKKKWK